MVMMAVGMAMVVVVVLLERCGALDAGSCGVVIVLVLGSVGSGGQGVAVVVVRGYVDGCRGWRGSGYRGL